MSCAPVPTSNLVHDKYEDFTDKEKDILEKLQKAMNERATPLGCSQGMRMRSIMAVRRSSFSSLDNDLAPRLKFLSCLKEFQRFNIEVLKDIKNLNLTGHLDIVASTIVQAKLSLNDIQKMIQICVSLHENYTDFALQILQAWQTKFAAKDDTRMMVDICFFANFISNGILVYANGVITEVLLTEGLSLLKTVLKNLIDDDEEQHRNMDIIWAFCHWCGADFAGLTSQTLEEDAAHFCLIPKICEDWLPPGQKLIIKNYLLDYLASMCRHLLKVDKELRYLKERNDVTEEEKEMSAETKELLTAMEADKKKLLINFRKFSNVLGEQMLDFETPHRLMCWVNKDDRLRYRCLTTIGTRVHVPALPLIPSLTEDEDEQEQERLIAEQIMLNKFLIKLQYYKDIDEVDSAAKEFYETLNTHSNIKSLVKTLFLVQRNRISDLIPLYSRLVATLQPCVPKVAMRLCNFLRLDFKFHLRRKSDVNLQSKLKVVTYIGELTNYQIYPRDETLYCFKELLLNFTGDEIKMCCHLFKVCGRFLLHQTDSHQLMKIYLELMMGYKSLIPSDSLHIIEESFNEFVMTNGETPEVGEVSVLKQKEGIPTDCEKASHSGIEMKSPSSKRQKLGK